MILIDVHTHNRREHQGDPGSVQIVSLMAGSGARPRWSWAPKSWSLGIHPWQVADMSDVEIAEALEEVAASSAGMIGEIGLDFLFMRDHRGLKGIPEQEKQRQREKQMEVFEAQLAIAERLGKPVVLHCVRAFAVVMKILARHPGLRGVIFHGFTGSTSQVMQAITAGYYLSLGEMSLRSSKTVEAIKFISLDYLLAETDESMLPIVEIYARLAAARGVTLTHIAYRIKRNYGRLVRKDPVAAGRR